MNKDINCIITGATDGLGKQTALELAKLDFNLCLVGRNQEKGDALINEIASSTGNHSLKYFNSDLSIIKNLDDLSTQIKKEYDWQPKIPIKHGLELTIDWYKEFYKNITPEKKHDHI